MLRRASQMSKTLLLFITLATLISGCATSPKVNVVQAADHTLTKEQLLAEISKLDSANKEIDSKKGVTGTNVAAALLFWPGLVYTHMDASEATRLVDQRRNHLTNLYNQKVAQEASPKTQKRSS